MSFLLFLLVPAVTFGLTEGAHWGFGDILRLLERREAQGQPIGTVEELLRALPPSLKRNFTFVYSTRNPFQEASPLYPRAIVFSERLLYTFNGHPSQRGYQAIEFMEFDRNRRRFELHELRFLEEGHVERSALNPTRCLECHGSDPKPIWNAYDQWPGVYGSQDDYLGAEEKAHYQAFQRQMAQDPQSRYALLQFPPKSSLSPYGRRGGIGDEDFRPNLLLTQLLTRMNALRVARLFEESPYFESLKWILPELVTSHDEVKGEGPLSVLKELAHQRLPRRAEGKEVSSLTFVAFGLPVERVNMEQGATRYQYADGTELFLSALRTALLRRLAEADPSFRRRMVVRHHANAHTYGPLPLYRFVDQLVGEVEETDVQHGYQAYLMDKAEEQWQQIAEKGLSRAPVPSGEIDLSRLIHLAEERRANPVIPLSCVVCHSIQKEAPQIPFDDEKELREKLRAENGRLVRAIRARTQPGASKGERMPPVYDSHFSPISHGQWRELVQYLESLIAP